MISYETELQSEYLKRLAAQEDEEYAEVRDRLLEMGVPEEEIERDGPYAVVLGLKVKSAVFDDVAAIDKRGYWRRVNSPVDIYALKAKYSRVDPTEVAGIFVIVLIVVSFLSLVLWALCVL